MSEWIEYTGSDEQIDDIKSAKSYAVMGIDVSNECSKFISGQFVWIETCDHPDLRIRAKSNIKEQMEASNVTHYLICQPHPYADMIKIWADTGCPVYAKHKTLGETVVINGPRVDWDYEEWEFSLTPFKDKS